jgi:hypothetical protein
LLVAGSATDLGQFHFHQVFEAEVGQLHVVGVRGRGRLDIGGLAGPGAHTQGHEGASKEVTRPTWAARSLSRQGATLFA